MAPSPPPPPMEPKPACWLPRPPGRGACNNRHSSVSGVTARRACHACMYHRFLIMYNGSDTLHKATADNGLVPRTLHPLSSKLPVPAQACSQQPARPTPPRLTPEAAVRVHSQAVSLPRRPRPPPPAALPCCERGRAQAAELVVAVGVDAGGAALCCSLLLQVGACAAGAPIMHLQQVNGGRHQQGAGMQQEAYACDRPDAATGTHTVSAYVAHLDAGWSTSCSGPAVDVVC